MNNLSIWDFIFGDKIPTVTYCELPIESVIARPGYFLSNIPYILLGIYIFTRPGRYSKIFGILTIMIGIFSALYDASFKYNAQILDLLGMFSFITFLLILNLKYLGNLQSKLSTFVFSFSLLFVYLSAILVLEGSAGRISFGLLVLGFLVTEYLKFKKHMIVENIKYFIFGLLLFIIGFLIWNLDANGIWCSSISIFNGRAIFHYLTGGSIYFLYKHFVK